MGLNPVLRVPARRSPRRLLALLTAPLVAAGLLASVLPASAATDAPANSAVGSTAATNAGLETANAMPIEATPRSKGFDGDGTFDLFARDNAGRLLLYPTDGRGNWQAPRVIGNGWHIYNLLVSPGDFDGDGTVDVMGRDGYGRLFLYQGNGAGAWKQAFQIGQGWQGFVNLIAPGDLNGDGTNDILAQDAAGNVTLYPGNGRGGWLAPSKVSSAWQGLDAVGAGHFYGTPEAVVLTRPFWGDLQVRSSPRNGLFFEYGHPSGYDGVIGRGFEVLTRFGVAGDFNGDGYNDVYGISPNGLLTMYLADPSGFSSHGIYGFKWKGQPVVGSGWNVMNYVF
ncbi:MULTISPECIES: FG-GAP repeat domain-containing protein [Paenarthrobacter]|uniref:FG-GAP repeat domain-containing protein n=1 Tax=Paenarthrobacter TaxID=1742992 RepID=UPI0023662B10|nr:VCBS repeat-containing protein [Paenarthrobacter sp. AB444]MDD7836314.1 VCBS repeat-containing protein [Paenarthrobacter sp. AB444]